MTSASSTARGRSLQRSALSREITRELARQLIGLSPALFERKHRAERNLPWRARLTETLDWAMSSALMARESPGNRWQCAIRRASKSLQIATLLRPGGVLSTSWCPQFRVRVSPSAKRLTDPLSDRDPSPVILMSSSSGWLRAVDQTRTAPGSQGHCGHGRLGAAGWILRMRCRRARADAGRGE